MLTVIFRASSQSDIGALAHIPVDITVPMGAVVVTTFCGRTGIGPVVERQESTCALCLAASGQHPGKSGAKRLRRQYRDRKKGRI